MRKYPLAILSAVLSIHILPAQTPQSRTEEIEAARKAKPIQVEQVTKAENFLRRFKDERFLERFSEGWNGWRPKIGNMVNGGGFAIGPEYSRTDLFDGQMTARASAQASTRRFLKLEAAMSLPKLIDGKLHLDIIGTHRNYGGLNFYGVGPDSRRTGRSNYRHEDTSADFLLNYDLTKYFKVGGGMGGLWVNVGPGNNRNFISSELQFPPATTPGIDQQTDFFRRSVFAQVDYRDNPAGAKSGGNYIIQHTWYQDRKLNRFGFRRLDVDLEQHIPFLNKTRRLVLRAKGTFTESDNNQLVPFYLMPTLGGANDLRGYRFFRFFDRNSVVYNAEYRWEIFSGLDGALFFDAGKVMPRRSLLAFSKLETAAGFGLRFNARNSTFMRIDTGFSQEGFQVWFVFNDVFNVRRFGLNSISLGY